MSDKQKETPILVSEITSDNSLVGVSVLESVLQKTTLNYSLFLENLNYRKYLNLGDEIQLLSEINKKRNNLHLLTSEKTSLNTRILHQYNSLNKVVDIDIAILQNTLLEELDPSSKSKLKVCM